MYVIKQGLKYIAVFSVTLAFLTVLLVMAAKIPRNLIKDNVRESAEYLCEKEVFFWLADGVESSKIDRYADSISLAIAYQYESENPLSSVMWSSYYYTDYQNENDNLLDAVTKDYRANNQYLRYWHGYNAVLRPLLTVFSIRQIYILNGVVMAGLGMVLFWMLLKHKAYAPLAGVIAGLIMTSVWYVPYSLEYTWMYILMLLMSVIAVWLVVHDKKKYMLPLLLVGGMVTNYMDFLTTETLTLCLPLLLVLWFDNKKNDKNSFRQGFFMIVKAAVSWGSGYAGMWISKWLMASAVLKTNAMQYVTEHIGERLGGNIGVGIWKYLTGAIFNNVKCLFVFDYGVVGAIIGVAVLIAILYRVYVYPKKTVCRGHILLYMIVGIVPYIRYLVLHNHSYMHFFFTYRAQLATVLSFVLIIAELSEWRWFRHADVRKRKL